MRAIQWESAITIREMGREMNPKSENVWRPIVKFDSNLSISRYIRIHKEIFLNYQRSKVENISNLVIAVGY